MLTRKIQSVAVIGAGIAGAAAAQALALAGHEVQVFDKSRGPGGRLATRRIDWVDAQGQSRATGFDHGAVAITARSAAFRVFVAQALNAGWLVEWSPKLADKSWPPEGIDRRYLPVPGMPTLCRHLLQGVGATWSFGVDRLHRGPLGWQVEAGGAQHAGHFDAVVLALPPAQAAPLLAPHRSDWARHAAVAPMQPCWTMMGIEDTSELAPDAGLQWDLARPAAGFLACLLRSDARPGRERVPGQAHWVLHARAGWSLRQLGQPASWVQAQMQAALAGYLGRPVDWLHCALHRWRYATARERSVLPSEASWWDASQGLGVCGDFLGGSGVEGAWLSAQALTTALLSPPVLAPVEPASAVPGAPGERRGHGQCLGVAA
jgi:hypothetical protein